MEVIRLLRHRWELRGTLYFEFQPGVFEGAHWQPGSVYIREEFWADLGAIVSRHTPKYSHYGMTAISATGWAGILSDCEQLAASLKVAKREQAAELLPSLFRWFVPPAGFAWRQAALRYSMLSRELSSWVREQLSQHKAVSVLGI